MQPKEDHRHHDQWEDCLCVWIRRGQSLNALQFVHVFYIESVSVYMQRAYALLLKITNSLLTFILLCSGGDLFIVYQDFIHSQVVGKAVKCIKKSLSRAGNVGGWWVSFVITP